MRSSIITALCVLCGAGCALGPGNPFARVTPSLEARYVVPEDRAVEGGFAKLSSDYEVRLSSASITVGTLQLLSTSAAGAATGGSFDPANPPPGYSGCHGGHCHHESGALVSYEEIEAELGGGPSASKTVELSIPVERVLNLLDANEGALICEPDCALPRTTISEARLDVKTLALEGVVRDSRSTPRIVESSFRMTLSEPQTLVAFLELIADERHAPNVALTVGVLPEPGIFDHVSWAVTDAQNGTIDLDSPANSEARAEVIEGLVTGALQLSTSRNQ